MALQSLLAYAAGKLTRVLPLQASAGASSAGSIVALNAAGVIDASMLLSTLLGQRNRLINADMRIDQRNSGAAQTITAGAALAYTVDRWYAYSTGANVTGQQVAGTAGSQYRYQFTGASGVTAIGFGQRIETQNSYDLAGTTVSLGVDISNALQTSVTWTAYYASSTDAFGTLASPTRTQIGTGTFTVTSTVARYTVQIAIPSAATTGIEIVFSVGAQTSGTWVIGNVQLEGTPTATPFEKRLVSTEQINCARYFQWGFFDMSGYSSQAGNTWRYALSYAVMRATPTAGSVSADPNVSQTINNANTAAVGNLTPYGCQIACGAPAAGSFGYLGYRFSLSAEL